MKLCDSNKEFIALKSHTPIPKKPSSKKDIVLCKYCKRTTNNGIRCLGMCVAESDY